MNTTTKQQSPGSSGRADRSISFMLPRKGRHASRLRRLLVVTQMASVIVVASLISQSANAASGTWLGSGTDGLWVTASNWVGNTVAGVVNSGVDSSVATFNNNTNTTVSLTDIRSVSGITFGDSAGAFVIQSGTSTAELDLTTNSAATLPATLQTTSGLANAISITAPIRMRGSGGTYTFISNATNSSATLSISGSLNLNSISTFVLDGSNTGNNIISGNITTVSSGQSFTKNGTGLWILTGSNSIGGGLMTINAGTLQIGNGGSSGTLLGSGNVSNNGALIFNRSDAITIGNFITGSGTVTQAGSGNLTLSGAGGNTYSGGTVITSGTLTNYGAGSSLGSGTLTLQGGTLNEGASGLSLPNFINVAADSAILTATTPNH